MREGRQEAIWNCVSQICYITAIFQSSDPKKIKRESFNDYQLLKKAMQGPQKASQEQLDRIARHFRKSEK